MKYDLIGMMWPALVGVLAAALILDKWVLPADEEHALPTHGGYREAVARATPSVVNIYTAKLVDTQTIPASTPLFCGVSGPTAGRAAHRAALGSGVILSSGGFIVTNNHVIAGADAIQVLLADGRSANASVVGNDPETDLAILQIDLPDLTPIELAQTSDIAVGDIVLAIGNPYGFGHSVSQGVVSGLGRFGLQLSTYEGYIQTDATVHLGSSGGALIDSQGRLVGINTLIYTAGAERGEETPGIGINLATPSDRRVGPRGHCQIWTGHSRLAGSERRSTVQRRRGYAASAATIVTNLAAGGPAERAGIRLNDIIVAMDGEPVVDGRAMLQVARLRPGHLLRVNVDRDGVPLELEAVVGTRNSSG